VVYHQLIHIVPTRRSIIYVLPNFCVFDNFFFIESYVPTNFLIVYNMGASLFFLLSAHICFGRIHSQCSLYYSLLLLLLPFVTLLTFFFPFLYCLVLWCGTCALFCVKVYDILKIQDRKSATKFLM
jgi:hypothetical protein